jgi:hypothetical protein
MRNAEAKLHSIEQITTLVSTLKVMLTPNRDYWTGALDGLSESSDTLYLGCQLLPGECQEYSIPTIVPQSVLGIGFHRTLSPNLKLKGGSLSGKSSGSAIASRCPLGAIARSAVPPAIPSLTAGIVKLGWVDFSPKAGFLSSCWLGWFGGMIVCIAPN